MIPAIISPLHYGLDLYLNTCLHSSEGIVGEADENGEDHYLWTYKKLEIGFNGNRIVDVNLTSEGKIKLVPNTKIPMSYSVSTGSLLLSPYAVSFCVYSRFLYFIIKSEFKSSFPLTGEVEEV